MKAPLPENEASRIRALREYKILDSSPEAAFDDFTLLASVICATPIALISFVDSERQWFKSKVGVSANETSRELSFCAHGILGTEVFVVPDAASDARFADNLLVTGEPHIRFYAGAPLITSSGDGLGSLCVIDRVPRELDENQLRSLQALGRQVVMQLELRRALETIDTLNRMLPICSYCKNIRNDDNYWQTVEAYISDHTAADFTHTICPHCYDDVVKEELKRLRDQQDFRGNL